MSSSRSGPGQRKCWTCQGTGHSSRDCPKRPPGKKVNIVEEEQPTMWIKLIETNQDSDYTPVRRGNRMRPVPKTATLGDFVLNNTFAQLQGEDKGAAEAPGASRALHKPPKTLTPCRPASYTYSTPGWHLWRSESTRARWEESCRDRPAVC